MFLVPALNEEVTIADSVERLLAVEAANKAIVVIDDGSTDGTPEVLAGLDVPDLRVLRRDPPDAQKGKAAALNDAWRHLEELLSTGRWAGWPREKTVVVVVDADGRLDPNAPEYAVGHFADDRVGGLQVRVRIYNRSRLLTWCQDVEFGIYGLLYQAGRTPWGTAGMGGNGQFNRLAALDSVADEESGGPWRDKLTEDQDLGLRLIAAGWRGAAEARTNVNQQGLPGLRRLLRQRTRWSQGNLQAMSQLGPDVERRPAVPRPARPRRVSAAAGDAGARRRRLLRRASCSRSRARRSSGATRTGGSSSSSSCSASAACSSAASPAEPTAASAASCAAC